MEAVSDQMIGQNTRRKEAGREEYAIREFRSIINAADDLSIRFQLQASPQRKRRDLTWTMNTEKNSCWMGSSLS